ncbi:response regulator [Candidatus Accumulibacter propinquus]|uniref:response regulator n=1 Tax=Candidatus Accumulibacter propinquus TaxID=2954380 RepID=UPI003DA99227
MATILIVDDTPENLAVLSGLLGRHYRIRAVSSGQRALRVADSEPRPDLILLDVMMPGLDGYQVIERLQTNPRTADIPVIFITAREASDDEQRGLALGAVDYITKPIRPAIVSARVKTHLELKAARDWLHDRNRSLEEEVTRRMADTLRVEDVSIRALARLAEVRDPETGNHLRRTQGYVRTLAMELCSHPRFATFLTPHNIELLVKSAPLHPRFATFLTPHNIELLVKSAPLHDIGKVGIPDHILLKPGKLTADEDAIMKTHSRLGFQALEQAEEEAEQPVAFLRMAKEITLSHHEKWDGKGYPDGLAGETIPISARLMALADVFDALITPRPYKQAFSLEQALEIIRKGRGSHFDPDVVDAFFSRAAEFIAIAGRHAELAAGRKPLP